MTKAYILGLLHDATERRTTYRIATKSRVFGEFLIREIILFGHRAWIYREGMKRSVWIVEFSKSLLKDAVVFSREEKIDYVRGYFDAEGGIAKTPKVRYYLYFAQKNLSDLLQVKNYLEELGIVCGVVHNPSKKVDPNYWRFFIKAESYNDFASIIGSDHPEKQCYLQMKI